MANSIATRRPVKPAKPYPDFPLLEEAASPREGGAVYWGCVVFAGLGDLAGMACDTFEFPADVAGLQLYLDGRVSQRQNSETA